MKYPCEDCLVDVMCRDICDDLIFFSDHLGYYIPRFLVKTPLRFSRLRHCVLKYGGGAKRVVTLDNHIVAKWNKMLKERKNGVC